MKVHHLNCGTMNPPASASVVLSTCYSSKRTMVWCWSTLGSARHDLRRTQPVGLDRCATCSDPSSATWKPLAHQIEKLGFRPRRCPPHRCHTSRPGPHRRHVRLPGMPSIHVTAAGGARRDGLPVEVREDPLPVRAVGAPSPKIVEHDPRGEKWRGFAAAKELDEISPGDSPHLATRPYSRPRLRSSRRRPPVGVARWRLRSFTMAPSTVAPTSLVSLAAMENVHRIRSKT